MVLEDFYSYVSANAGAGEFVVYSTLESKSQKTIIPSDHVLLNFSDPFQSIIESQESQESASIIFTNDQTVLKALPHLQSLRNNTIINIALSNYQSVVALKDLNFTTLISSTKEDVLNALTLSHILVNSTNSPILHFINESLVEQSPNVKISKSLSKILETQATDLVDGLNILNSNGMKYNYVDFSKGSRNSKVALVNLGSHYNDLKSSGLPTINIKIFKPFEISQILGNLTSSVEAIAILEDSNSKPLTKFSPLLLEFFQDPTYLVDNGILKITSSSIGDYDDDFNKLAQIVTSNLSLDYPIQNLYFGNESQIELSDIKVNEIEKISKLESSYLTILDQVFGSNLKIYNQFNAENINASSPEFGFGSYIYLNEQKQKLIKLIHASLDTPDEKFQTPKLNELVEKLSKWLVYHRELEGLSQDKINTYNQLSIEIIKLLKEDDSETSKNLLSLENSFFINSNWLIGSDSWAYDLGTSGIHHVLESNENINVLVIDNEPYSTKTTNTKSLRKKDIGLYAMNYGNAYVGSIAIYSSYTQMLTTLIEAAQFQGPSIILAYLPLKNEFDTPLDILTNTKNSVESGFIPLYRYNPFLDSKDSFKLDSTVIKEQLKNFLDRENKLTLLSAKNPQFARSLKQSSTSIIKQKQDKKAQQAYDQLLEGLSGPPISIYFASDGGNAENVAKKLGKRASARGFKSTVLSMDDIILEDLVTEELILFITSTSGQGEFPQNGKNFWDSIKNSGDLDLEFSKISVFGLGDSEYWPRAQDKHYYNKPAKDLHSRLLFLNAKELIPLGLGDDQDADGFQTGYKEWESQLWKALGVDDIKTADEPPPITNEDIKIASDFLRGTIADGLKDESTGAIASSDQQLTKFHGIYMQDDRDLRDSRKAAGLEPFYIFMARVRLPGGITTPDQWLMLDRLADERGNGTVKLTTRATYQLHGIVKHNLKPSIRAMNSVLMDTLGACGDVNRNVMVSALPSNAYIHGEVNNVAKRISEHLLPQTTAYHEIWLKGDDPEDDEDANWPETFEQRKDGPKKIKTLVAGNALVDTEPFYGPTYLPRKYKINITVPPYNDVDVWSSDVGLITIIEDNEVVGFNVLVGGGMGSTHNNKKTYPRTGSSFGFVPTDQVHLVCEKIMLVQRDHGNRKDRKNARLKYTVDTLGVEVYKEKVEELWGQKFQPERAYEIKDNIDHFGWVTDELDQHHFTCFIENGRVEDTPELPQKTGLKKIAEYFKSNPKSKGTFRLTGNQHVLISTVSNEELPTVKQLLHDYKLDNTDFSALRLSSAACVAFPTCGLAMAESERYLPVLINKIEEALEEYGLRHDSVVMRMTGCPNGCARPWLAEVALVGKAYGVYNLMLGGGYFGQRLNKIYKQSIKEDEVLSILKPLFKRWALERQDGEHFGDFLVRVGVIKPTLEGKYFHDDIPEQV